MKKINFKFVLSSSFWSILAVVSFCLSIAGSSVWFVYFFLFSILVIFILGILSMRNPPIEKHLQQKKIKSKIIIINILTLIICFVPIYSCSVYAKKLDPIMGGIEGGITLIIPVLLTLFCITLIFFIKEVIIGKIKKNSSNE